MTPPGYWNPTTLWNPLTPWAGTLPDFDDRVLSQRCYDLLDMIPPWTHGDNNIQAALQAIANELDRIDLAMEAVINSFFPYLAGNFIYLWEVMLGIGVPPGLTLAQRQQRVLAFLTRRINLSAGSSWVQIVNLLLGSGWSWQRWPDGGTPRNTLIITIPFTSGSPQATDLVALLQTITPANTVIVVSGGEGFIVQQSQIQEQPL